MNTTREEANKAYAQDPPANEAGRAWLAHVSSTEAVAFDPDVHDKNKPETWPVLKAGDFDREKHGHMQFFCVCCLDKGNKVQLRKPSTGTDPKGGYYQNIPFDVYDRETGDPVLDPESKKPKIETRRYYFPPHFTTMPGQKHVCEAARHQQELALSVREMGGTTYNSEHGVRSLSLVIPAGQRVIEPSKRFELKEGEGGNFNQLSSGSGVSRRIHRGNRENYTRKEGVRSAEDLGVLLTHTEFDQEQRKRIILRNGEKTLSLAQLYHANPVDMHEKLRAREEEFLSDTGGGGGYRHMAAFSCHLGNSKKAWIKEHDGSTSIRIEGERKMSDGHVQDASVKINFQSPVAEAQFRKAFDSGERDFLFFSENTFVKPDRSAVKMTVFTPHQMAPWKPPSPQLQLEFPSRPSISDVQDDGPQHH